jgi:hypothetical protein
MPLEIRYSGFVQWDIAIQSMQQRCVGQLVVSGYIFDALEAATFYRVHSKP